MARLDTPDTDLILDAVAHLPIVPVGNKEGAVLPAARENKRPSLTQ